MAAIKLYNSKAWVTRRYVVNKRTPEQIAQEAGCSVPTIYRKLREFKLIK